MDEMISIADGAIFNITNGDANSSIMGDGNTPLSAIVNVSLFFSNIVATNMVASHMGGNRCFAFNT